jgi:flavin reductase (DIM6/NTAB) family NADH-FMN oxidoreductase RutF
LLAGQSYEQSWQKNNSNKLEKIMAQHDLTTLFKASYGLYLLSAKSDEQDNACIINTFMQITSNAPVGCLVSVNKQNYTKEMISKTRKFNLSVLTVETPFELFKRFGFQSGHEVDKFKDFTDFARSENGLTYLTSYANAFLSFDVLDKIDFGTHTLFTATLTESQTLNQKESITYDFYHRNVKPKPQAAQKTGYRCTICGYVYEGEPLPPDFICPLCKHGAADFEKN